MSAKTNYIEALYRLSKSCPPEVWDAYVKAFTAMVPEEMERSLRAPVDEALIGVGWNRCLVDMRNDLHRLSEYEKKRNERSSNSS